VGGDIDAVFDALVEGLSLAIHLHVESLPQFVAAVSEGAFQLVQFCDLPLQFFFYLIFLLCFLVGVDRVLPPQFADFFVDSGRHLVD
jgi:hypothetical protein